MARILRLLLGLGVGCLFFFALIVAFEAGGYFPEHFFPKTAETKYQGDLKELSVSETLKDVHKIVIVGDSLTALASRPRGFLSLLREYLTAIYPSHHIEIVNAGLHGDRSKDMVQRFSTAIKEHPNLVIIICGINDLSKNESSANFEQNMESMVKEAKAANVQVMLCSLPLCSEAADHLSLEKAEELNQMLVDLSKKEGLKFADLYGPMKDVSSSYAKQIGFSDRLLTVDGVHLSAAGNRVVAQALLEALGVPKEIRAKVVTTSGIADF